MADLAIVVPSRGRPASVGRLYHAWHATAGFVHADLFFSIDHDDPEYSTYVAALNEYRLTNVVTTSDRVPMVSKLDVAARLLVDRYAALGFAGDDHLPRTPGWAVRYLDALAQPGVGIVYGNDLARGAQLPTQWAMRSSIVRVLDRMVPAPVEHQFCDRSILDLGRAAGCIRYLPNVVVEHMHYAVGKSTKDATYFLGNTKKIFEMDRARYLAWRADGGLARDVARVRGALNVEESV